RTTGLWGSSFSRSRGYQPSFSEALWPHLKHLAADLLFFCPRREVTIELVNATDEFPRKEGREAINRYLEGFYNKKAPANTYVPYYWWQFNGTRVVAEPETVNVVVDTHEVPKSVREKVMAKLHEMSPRAVVKETDTLGTDLGIDSLMVAELQAWIQQEFGQPVNNTESFRTVASVLLAAIGQSESIQPLKEVPSKWFVPKCMEQMQIAPGTRITELFLENAVRRPDFPIIADQISGVVTFRRMVLAIMVLKPLIEKIPAERVGFIMPACVSANVVYLAMLFAGKVPVMINWTVGLRNMKHCMKNAGVEHVLTAQAVIERLEGRGTDFGELKDKFVYLENMAKSVGILRKLCCLAASHLSWHSLRHVKTNELCAILFTSGSENFPKAVPIKHTSILTCTRSALKNFDLYWYDTAIAMLPPFHSFGLLINFIMADCANMRLVYHANPLEGDMIARLISAYQATMVIGTPTFTHNILKNATKEMVKSLRVIITGAEKCPQHTFDLIKEKCVEDVRLNEGYGITECAPLVALNKPGATYLGALGKILDCMEWTIRDENLKPVPVGETGMLYVMGENVMSGYLNYDGESPFVEIDGKTFYRTGDLVAADENGFIFFKGRKKRFVKIAGEMVSLPAVEEILMKAYREPDGDLPLAVEAGGTEEQPELVLFTILDLNREEANKKILEAGLSPIHSIKRVVKLEEIPLLGSGKTDYQTLKAMLKAEEKTA
ncbi:MAG: AMP-binding protein, partial [Victivallales bacterium]|nr:AMP-binding protein [Victivallales bacterium]